MKRQKRIMTQNSFDTSDDIEYGNPKRIPLWPFRFLYDLFSIYLNV